ncbi:MAG TPA: tetratricopeptide repeat protein [Terriglobales bacterium]|nr:tetratricopeptide repeat protein [Terriglobales bacterium]
MSCRHLLRSLSLLLLIASLQIALSAQDNSSPSDPSQQDASTAGSPDSQLSSSKDTRIDLSPPNDDAANHPEGTPPVVDAEDSEADVQEFHAWDPHKAVKDIEVGNFYYKKKNYRAALERYKDALIYKPNDAVANFRLAECEEKTGNPSEAAVHYSEYLKILPHGPFAADAQKALERLKGDTAKKSPAKK